MFETTLRDPADLREVDDATLLAAVERSARVAAAAEARKLAAAAELHRRRCTQLLHPDWAADDWDAAAAELACALNLSHGQALRQFDLGLMLRDRFPKVGARFLAGDIPLRTITTLAYRTALITDLETLIALDEALSTRAGAWGPLSQKKLEQAIDVWIERYDRDAVRRARSTSEGRDVTFGDPNDNPGITSLFGRLHTPDAALLQQRINAMANSVCADDPRTLAQRRADALGALGANSTHLQCRCDNPHCDAGADDGRATNVTVHILANKTAAENAKKTTRQTPRKQNFTLTNTEDSEPPTALIPGTRGGIIPAPLLAELIAAGAKIRFVAAPDAAPEKCYRPSTKLAEFVRTRDMTCRWKGCDRPAIAADIDHTIPYPHGHTHASNNLCYCRLHHLIKTFWPGWSQQQYDDATLDITTPSGRTYTTKPLSALLFPTWNTSTPPQPGQPGAPPPSANPNRGLMMPKRRRTRAQSRTDRINAERALNAIQNGPVEMPPY